MKSIILHVSERRLTCVKYNRDGDLFFTAGADGSLNVYNADTGHHMGSFHYITGKPRTFTEADIVASSSQPDKVIAQFDVTLDSSRIACARFDAVVIYDVKTGGYLDYLHQESQIAALEWNQHPLKQNKIVIALLNRGGEKTVVPSIRILALNENGDPQNKNDTWQWNTVFDVRDFHGFPTKVAWGPFDDSIIAVDDRGSIYKWNINGELTNEVAAHTQAVTDISFNKDRSLMITCSTDQTVALWRTADMGLIKRYTTDRPLRACSINPLMDAENPEERKYHIAVAGGQEAAEVTTTRDEEGMFGCLIVNILRGVEVGRVEAHYSPVLSLEYKPDGSGFGTGAIEGQSRLVSFDSQFLEANN